MLTDIMMTGSYGGSLSGNVLLNPGINIENILSLSPQYNSLESQLNQIQAEPEDPPETMHTPWGVWRHWRDALHSIDEKYDAEHTVRKGHAAEDILHNAHYVPVIGDPEHKEESYEMNFEYDDPIQLEVYNSKINLEYSAMDFEEEIENKEIPINEESEDNSVGLEDKDVDEESKEPNSAEPQSSKNNINLEVETELTRIFEKISKSNNAESKG